MALSVTKPGGWGVNQKFRSSEANAIDANFLNALDKTAAGDTLSGVVTLASGAGLTLQSGSALTSTSGASINLALPSGSSLTMASGTTFSALGGGTLSGTFSLAGTLSLTAATTASDITCSGTTRVKLAPRTRTRVVDSSPISLMLSGGTVASFVAFNGTYRQNSTLSGSQIRWGIPVKDGCFVSSVKVYVSGFGHTNLPTNKPVLTVIYYDSATGSIAPLGTATDGSASAAALDARHSITVFMGDVIPTSTACIAAIFYGETGSNTATIDVSPPEFTATYAQYDET